MEMKKSRNKNDHFGKKFRVGGVEKGRAKRMSACRHLSILLIINSIVFDWVEIQGKKKTGDEWGLQGRELCLMFGQGSHIIEG
ncbi:MAG: hypothetical protein A2V45_06295 [Candidatus Aminicenantes bacterium RBG_19FT_COMBO_58_17]|nr:MAG: hypothetical protein A2V45_06295 [Candidatus Aminicenantes bacterium RBG_19FT_COMBO_58_17]